VNVLYYKMYSQVREANEGTRELALDPAISGYKERNDCCPAAPAKKMLGIFMVPGIFFSLVGWD